MTRIRRTELDELVDDVKGKVATAQEQLDSLGSSLKDVSGNDGFSGTGASKVKAFLSDGPVPMASDLSNALADLAKDIGTTAKSFDDVDTAKDAVIGTQRLSDLKTESSGYVKAIKEALKAVNTAVGAANKVPDVSISKVSVTDFKDAASNLGKELDKTKEDIVTWDDMHSDDAQYLQDRFRQISNALSIMSGQHKNGGMQSYDSDGKAATQLGNLQKKIINDQRIDRGQIAPPDPDAVLADVKAQAKLDYDAGKITKDVFDKITHLDKDSAGIIIENLAQQGIDKIKDKLTDVIVDRIEHNTDLFMNRGLDAALADGGGVLVTEVPSAAKQFLRKGLGPIVGGVLDAGVSMAQGENATDAVVKAGAHAAIGVGAAAAGGQIGAAAGTLIGGPVGTVVGYGAGMLIGYVGDKVFDSVYDHRGDIAHGISHAAGKVGKAIGSLFKW